MKAKHETHVYCVAVGHSSLAVVDSMASSDSTEGVGYFHVTKLYADLYREILQCHLLFIVIDSTIGDELHLALDLATRVRAAGILTLGMCCVEESIVSDTDSRWRSLEKLRSAVDTLAIVASTKVPSLGFQKRENDTFDSMASECQSIVHSLSYIFSHKSFVGIDFEDVREALSGSGYAAIGIGHAQGDDRGVTACANAIEDLTNKGIDLQDVHGVSVKISGHHASLNDFSDVMEHLESSAAEDCPIVAAAYWEDPVDDESLSVSLLVSGLTRESISTTAGLPAQLERKVS